MTVERHVMDAQAIARSLGGRKVGTCWMATCPAHDDREPSLAIRDGDDGVVLVRCHAGCDQKEVIAALRSRGLWPGFGFSLGKTKRPISDKARSNLVDRDAKKRSAAALRIWQETTPASETLAETYLKSRGIHIRIPANLRFHPALKHSTGGAWPAMVSLITRGRDAVPIGIHRTFLARDGAGKAPFTPNKMMLGHCRGGAVRLGIPEDVLMVGEGIETCLSAMQAKQIPAWAALSTSGLFALDLPAAVQQVIVLADGDDSGDTAARDCALRWTREGRHIRIARPPRGLDFNDLLLGRTAHVEEGAV